MGSSLRKPVEVNNWESLTSEAARLEKSGTTLLGKARVGVNGLESRMRAVKSQSLIIRMMLLHEQGQDETRQIWITTWWDSMDTIFTEFQVYRNNSLSSINELEERLL
jgi:hypothetical protein